jgi:hypothetical protein
MNKIENKIFKKIVKFNYFDINRAKADKKANDIFNNFIIEVYPLMKNNISPFSLLSFFETIIFNGAIGHNHHR